MSTNISHFIGNFNPRSHEGSDQYLERVRSIDSEISIHAPTRGATAVTTTKETDPVFQSTLPRGERRDVIYGDVKEIQISIHAPTRGATNDSGHFSFKNGISIHAPTRGATLKDISIFINTLDFNPRSHEGSDAAESAGAATLQLFQSTLPRGERQYMEH